MLNDSENSTISACGGGGGGDARREALLDQLYDSSFRMMRSQQHDALRAFEPLGLRPLHAFVLVMLAQETYYPKEVASVLAAPASVVSVLLSELEDKGLLRRAVDHRDRRRFELRLTAEGNHMLANIRRAWYEIIGPRFDRLDLEDLEALVRIQRTLVE